MIATSPLRGSNALVIVPAAVALAVGSTVVVSPPAALAIVVCVAACALIGAFGSDVIKLGPVAALPWLVVFGEILPPLLKTFVAGGAAMVFLAAARREHVGGRSLTALVVGIVLLFVPVAISIVSDGAGAQLIQAAKYVVFPMMVVAVATGASSLVRPFRTAVLASGAVALAVHLGVALAGLGSVGTKYSSGERLGFANAHDVAFLASAVAAGVIASSMASRWKLVVLAVALNAAVLSGVRTALVGLVLVALGAMIAARMNPRIIALVAVAIVAVFLSGADAVAVHRYDRSLQRGEFASFASAGSGRGEIYTAALRHYVHGSPTELVFGTGLRSIGRFEQEELGGAFVGHSDIVEVLVELGIVGLIGLVLIWIVLVRFADSRLPLLPVLAFAIFNGSLEYSAPLVVALVLCTGRLGAGAPVQALGRLPAIPTVAAPVR